MEILRESVFISSIRSFFKAFCAILGIFFAFIPIFLILGAISVNQDSYPKNDLVILPDAGGKRAPLPSSVPVVLRLNIVGEIGKCNLVPEIVESQFLDAEGNLLKKDRVKALLLYVNSPGGSVPDIDSIYYQITKFKEKHKIPVYAYVDSICASGGMYIASAADRIEASPTSIIGSIGVIVGPFFNLVEGLNKFGVKTLTITEGTDKDEMSPFRIWKEDDGKTLQAIAANSYERFLDIVSKNRPLLTKEKLKNELGAKIFDAQKAEELGYVDNGNSRYETALAGLVKAAKIEKSYQVIEIRPRKSFADLLSDRNALFKTLFGKNKPVSLLSYLYDPSR